MMLAELPKLKAALDIALTFLDGSAPDRTVAIPSQEIDDAHRAEQELRAIWLKPSDIVELVRADQIPDEARRVQELAPNFAHVLSNALWWEAATN